MSRYNLIIRGGRIVVDHSKHLNARLWCGETIVYEQANYRTSSPDGWGQTDAPLTSGSIWNYAVRMDYLPDELTAVPPAMT